MSKPPVKFESLMNSGLGMLGFGFLGLMAPSLLELGMGLMAAGAMFSLGAYAGRKGYKRLVWLFAATGLIVGSALATRIKYNRSHQRYNRQVVLPAPQP